jgi:drug/metabolite transporter (DMT)-like permease
MSVSANTALSGREWAAPLALSLAALFWSGNFIAGRALRDDIDPITLNSLRWMLASALFLPISGPACLRHAVAIRRHWRWLLALSATGIAGFHTTVYVALTQTTATNALLVLALAPVATLSGSALIGASRPGALQWAGSAVSLAGAVLLVTRADSTALRTLALNPGDVWMLAAVVIWAAYSLLLRRRPAELPPTVMLAGSMGLGALLMLPALVLTLPMARFAAQPEVLWPLTYVVIFPSIFAFWLWGYGVARIGPERAGQFVHLMPVFGPVLAMAILGERVVPVQLAGALVIFAGIALVMGGQRRPNRHGGQLSGAGVVALPAAFRFSPRASRGSSTHATPRSHPTEPEDTR